MNEPLYMWTIYEHPSDYPEHFVLRRCQVRSGGLVVNDLWPTAVTATLEECRAALPPGLFNLHRKLEDDRVIVESWV